MKKFLAMFAGVAAAVAMTGCSTIETASNTDFNGQEIVTSGTQVGHVSATTNGLYLLMIPLITGSETNIGIPALLSDTVNSQALSRIVTTKAKEMGGSKVLDLTTSSSSAGFIFYWRSSSASANVTK